MKIPSNLYASAKKLSAQEIRENAAKSKALKAHWHEQIIDSTNSTTTGVLYRKPVRGNLEPVISGTQAAIKYPNLNILG